MFGWWGPISAWIPVVACAFFCYIYFGLCLWHICSSQQHLGFPGNRAVNFLPLITQWFIPFYRWQLPERLPVFRWQMLQSTSAESSSSWLLAWLILCWLQFTIFSGVQMDNTVLKRPTSTRSSCFCSRPIRLFPTSGFSKLLPYIHVRNHCSSCAEKWPLLRVAFIFLSVQNSCLKLQSSKPSGSLWVKRLMMLSFMLDLILNGHDNLQQRRKWNPFSLRGAETG